MTPAQLDELRNRLGDPSTEEGRAILALVDEVEKLSGLRIMLSIALEKIREHALAWRVHDIARNAQGLIATSKDTNGLPE